MVRLGLAIVYPYIGESAFCSDSAEGSEGEIERVLNDNFSLRCLVGSDGHERHRGSPKSVHIILGDLCAFLSQSENVGSIGVV